MSLKTWKKEFYPRAAHATKPGGALKHSLRKWEGLTKANLRRHKVRLVEATLVDIRDGELIWQGELDVNAASCALVRQLLRS